MEMPDYPNEIYVHCQKDDGYVGNCIYGQLEISEGYENKYHHDRIHQEVIRQRDELQAKLDKAKWQDCVMVENFEKIISRRIMDLADIMGAFPELEADECAWSHLLTYAPKHLLKGNE